MLPKMELLVWVGDFGLISMSMECIRAIAYINLAKAPVQITYSKNPYLFLHQDYPIFRHGNLVITDFSDMINYLRMRNYFVDYGLSGKQISEAYAILNLVTVNLRPIFYYVFWIDKQNYEELTSAWYTKVMPIPFNLLYPRKKRKYARNFMEAMYPNEQDREVIKNAIQDSAADCFSCLAARLQHNEYFYGNSPTSLDAIVYAYLAPLVKVPFPSDHIPKLLATWPELVNYVKRVDRKIFPDIIYERKYVKKQEPTARSKGKDDDEFGTTLSMKIFMFAAVTCATLGYAASQNMIDVDKWRRIFIG